MRRRTAVAGGSVLGIGLLIGWLAGLFLPFGSGGGDGSGDEGPGDTGQVRVQTPQSGDAIDAANRDQNVSYGSETESDPLEPQRSVDVVIDGETYLVAPKQDGEPRQLALDRVVELVKQATGNSAGVRVRISRRSSSIPLAEDALEQALLKADIPREAVYWVEETAQ